MITVKIVRLGQAPKIVKIEKETANVADALEVAGISHTSISEVRVSNHDGAASLATPVVTGKVITLGGKNVTGGMSPVTAEEAAADGVAFDDEVPSINVIVKTERYIKFKLPAENAPNVFQFLVAIGKDGIVNTSEIKDVLVNGEQCTNVMTSEIKDKDVISALIDIEKLEESYDLTVAKASYAQLSDEIEWEDND